MDNYRKMVKKLADAKSGQLIPNGGTDHAEVLIENIFSHAQNVVRIFSGELNSRVYGSASVLAKAKEFLKSGTSKKIKILIQDTGAFNEEYLAAHDLVKTCKEVSRNACEIKLASENDREIGSHFVIMDHQGYRIEPDRMKPTGVGCFNDSKRATALSVFYDKMFDRGDHVNI